MGAGIEKADRLLTKQPLHAGQLLLALLQRGVAAIGAALVADFVQPLWRYGEAKQFVTVGLEGRRQLQPTHVLLDEGVVGGANAELQRQIEAGGGFAAAGDADQDDVSLVVLFGGDAIVVGQREVDRFDAVVIELAVLHAVGAMGAGFGLHPQLLFQRADEGVEKVVTARFGF